MQKKKTGGEERDDRENAVVYRDGRYTLGEKDGAPCVIAGGAAYRLSCHPYEPCLYITDEKDRLTAVHNAFDPSAVLCVFAGGGTVTSITGLEYNAQDFCRMVEYAAGRLDLQIDEAEKVFGGRAKRKNPPPERKKEKENPPLGEREEDPRPETGRIAEDERFAAALRDYPDAEIDFCLVITDGALRGYGAHRSALALACRSLFFDGEEAVWDYDLGRAEAKPIGADALFAPDDPAGPLSYRRAFLSPPHGNAYTGADFERVNDALFPNGREDLEVYEWTTDWSEYFDEGHEWWGALCLTVYDKSLDRFAVILASATD
ncbi:MAG: hypothetical protein IJR89_04570 [Clostridia bacterium]|nr:hypothetical protein [Clostridia bacterium]